MLAFNRLSKGSLDEAPFDFAPDRLRGIQDTVAKNPGLHPGYTEAKRRSPALVAFSRRNYALLTEN